MMRVAYKNDNKTFRRHSNDGQLKKLSLRKQYKNRIPAYRFHSLEGFDIPQLALLCKSRTTRIRKNVNLIEYA